MDSQDNWLPSLVVLLSCYYSYFFAEGMLSIFEWLRFLFSALDTSTAALGSFEGLIVTAKVGAYFEELWLLLPRAFSLFEVN